MGELIDVCDENDKLLGVLTNKSEVHKDGLWHRSSHIWIYNSKKEILLQLRAKSKDVYPDRWDVSVAGHVSSGEEPLTCGLREMKEEIGLKANKLDFLKIVKADVKYGKIKDNQFYYIYLFKFDGSVNDLKLQKEEVQDVRFFPIAELKRELKIDSSKFVPHDGYWLEIIDEIERLD